MQNQLKKFLNLISCLILLVVMSGIIFYYGKDIYTILAQVKWPIICVLIFLHIPMIALGGLAFKVLCIPFNIHLRWQDWAGLSFIANLLNQFFPYRPGMGFRYLYLRQRYKMKSTEFIYVMLVYFLFTLTISATFTLAGGSLMNPVPKSFNSIMVIALCVMLGGYFILWLIMRYPLQASLNSSLTSRILLTDPVVLVSASALLILINFLTALTFYVTFIAVGALVPFSSCLFLVGIIIIAMIFPITPGNIGVLEALIGALTQMIYQDFSLGFSVIALYRASQWIPSFILGSAFSLALMGTLIPYQKAFKLGTSKPLD